MGAVVNPTSQTRENEDQSAQWVMGLEMPSSDPFHQAGAFLPAVQPIKPSVLSPTLFHKGICISQLYLALSTPAPFSLIHLMYLPLFPSLSLSLFLPPSLPPLGQTKPSGGFLVFIANNENFTLTFYPPARGPFLHSL